MRIFLDTNIFYNNWFVNKANFQYLFHFLNNEDHDLLLSNIVLEETNNIRNRQVDSNIEEIQSSISKLKKLNSNNINFDKESLGISDYNLLNELDGKINNITPIEYESISHNRIVSRLFKNLKPFSSQEKGYRDTLIWLSLVKHVKESGRRDEVIFITENSSDFYSNNKDQISFHSDLQKDLEDENISVKIIPYKNLHEFVKTQIDKETHSFDHTKYESIFEEYVEINSIEYLESLDNESLSFYLEDSIFESKVSNITNITVDILEGFEDNSIERVSQVDGNKVYVSYEFNLRRVFIQIELPYLDYITNKAEIDSKYEVINNNGQFVTIEKLVRPYFDVSFIFSPHTEELESFSVDHLWLRR
ncbi:PIN domain-containing protein [Enterobacter cloacae subsp. cloacae]|uniref:PIN domain-containing protein n=1 Tax=Enterobacter cloacae TaxID=550 RepID=UPI002182BE79|nr:PIN domain-containing protein [Enterobacter cloacae]EMC0025967.1 DUF4935 domain-containing protein [Enterobacter cloacae]MCT2765034.1 DUF4935 domain-containing protein [Enterobacter cloacae]MDR1749448.1 PIN domain-containing protein [Enterobacter cloacae]WLD31023.1 PIN domain-containing protein [Enterobacter cloacae subsp. cloacae]HDC4527247.1 DUF4935 domain-containing protein [Enterobacter cloacae]